MSDSVLSIDIGLRNLALCIMNATDKTKLDTYKIQLWNVYNTLDSDDYTCHGIQKNQKVCGKKCGYKYLKENILIHCCKMHFPKDIKVTPKNIFKKKMIDSYLLQDIANIVLLKIQEIYDENVFLFNELKSVVIELQPKINCSAKFISHIIYGKLVELLRHQKTTIRFVRASQKLRAYTGPVIECKLKGKYAQRKWLSIQYTKWFLENKFSKEEKDKWMVTFLSHKKQDDLGDTFLMVVNSIHGIPKKRKISKKW
jgi:hypothetical protein